MELRLKKVCYKVSLCENCQRQSCKAFIGLTNKNDWWEATLVHEIWIPIHSSYYIHGPWVHEINFCRFICVMNDGPYTCCKTEVFLNIYICSFSTIFYAIFISDTCLSNRKSISKPNVYKISQSTADMNYIQFRKTDGRHIGFPFPVSILTYV